ncbi:MAG TPA: MFS transporter [Coleofasciculaceae cyanobacterium]
MKHLPFLLQPASRQVWVQAVGRSLYQAGYGSIQFFIPLIFVNQVGLSATVVGIGIGSGSLAGLVGHFLGGYLADSPAYGRKRALLFSAGLSIMAAIALALTQSLPMLVVANLFMGLSAGCYWTAADAAVIDVTTSEHRHKAFAILVLADSLGGGLGIWGGGMLLSLVHEAQILFFVGSLILVVFLVWILIAVTETRQEHPEHSDTLQGFVVALRDRSLLLFVLVNVLFTTYIALVSSTLPLYFTNVVLISPEATPASGTSIGSIANLYTWCYIGLGALLQVPIVQVLGSVPKVRVLGISMLLWGTGFILVWVTGMVTSMQLVWVIASLSVLSVAATIYKPFAPAIVAELAPESLRGAYLAISYQCWSIGYFVGPVLGGWAIDQSGAIAHSLWVVATIGAFFSLFILYFLARSRVSHSVASIEDTASVTQ